LVLYLLYNFQDQFPVRIHDSSLRLIYNKHIESIVHHLCGRCNGRVVRNVTGRRIGGNSLWLNESVCSRRVAQTDRFCQSR
jgi:hypothetical protein